ncbi:XdhC family protein [Oxyplasma meridianum]|uniref:XdhC family protein n=1 Tax=Oxyplasma meridianum TaxID=3073602 RepID=A0AAX4NH06_9ARCH
MYDEGFPETIMKLKEDGKQFTIATVIKTEGSSVAKPGFKALVQGDHIIHGNLGGSCPESVIVEESEKVLKTGKPKIFKVHMEKTTDSLTALIKNRSDDDIYVETFCGGSIEVYLEPYFPTERLVIIGQGGRDEVENQLLKFGKLVGFKTLVVDPLPNLDQDPDELISDLGFKLDNLEILPTDFVVILTKGDTDIPALEAVSKHKPSYVGIMASRKRFKNDVEILKGKGISESFLKSVHSPIGMDIGAVTPSEIALSIISEIIKEKRKTL